MTLRLISQPINHRVLTTAVTSAHRGAARAQLRRAIGTLESGDVLVVTRLDRLARSTRDLLNKLAAITDRKAGFQSLGDTWADTTTARGRLTLTVLGGVGGLRA